MKTYRFLVECVFVLPSGESAEDLSGYFATITVRDVTAKASASQISGLLRKRMRECGVKVISEGIRKTRCRIEGAWEMADDAALAVEDAGFSFFRIGLSSMFLMLLKFWWVKASKSHMIVDLSPETE